MKIECFFLHVIIEKYLVVSAGKRYNVTAKHLGSQVNLRKEKMINNELQIKYNVLQLLHRGIGGDVWLAEHKSLGCKRVLKIIEKNHPYHDLLAREAIILQQCQHSSIPIIYDILEFDTQTYIVEEFIQGENLKQYIARQGSLSASLLLEISIQLCEILLFLHNPARKILHLDLKPENILFQNHKMKLIDFGSAICRSRQDEDTVIFGTPAYCAPEMKTMGRLTEQTDIYCMGKCMEYMLFHTPRAPKGYRNIVKRCLRQHKQEYKTAEQVYTDLKKLYHKKRTEKCTENWFAVTGVNSEQEGTMAALQLAMYLRDRYKKQVLYLDCTKSHLMEQLEQSESVKIKSGEKSFAFECNQITVAKRVIPQEVGGFRGRGFTYAVACFGEQSPLLSAEPFHHYLFAGSITELNLKQWEIMLPLIGGKKKTAIALTGGNGKLAKKSFGHLCTIKPLPMYFEAFEQSKPFRKQMKQLLDGM